MTNTPQDQQSLRRFMAELRHHLQGWRDKVQSDFAKPNFDQELAALAADPVYSKFHLASADYVLIRLMGRMSISIGRRLGEIYDKIPRIAAQARYGLPRDQVVAVFDGLELDVRLCAEEVSDADAEHLQNVSQTHLGVDLSEYAGLGIEIRYNFNPNDSARLRKDKKLAELLRAESLLPVYLVFAENSPRLADAVASLTRAGWTFVIGAPALSFMADLVGFDISSVLDLPEVSAEIQEEMRLLMSSIQDSHAFRQITVSER